MGRRRRICGGACQVAAPALTAGPRSRRAARRAMASGHTARAATVCRAPAAAHAAGARPRRNGAAARGHSERGRATTVHRRPRARAHSAPPCPARPRPPSAHRSAPRKRSPCPAEGGATFSAGALADRLYVARRPPMNTPPGQLRASQRQRPAGRPPGWTGAPPSSAAACSAWLLPCTVLIIHCCYQQRGYAGGCPWSVI